MLVDGNKGEGSDTNFSFQAQVAFEEGGKGVIASEVTWKVVYCESKHIIENVQSK